MRTNAIPCMMMRGGTSRGPYFLASDLPQNKFDRDVALISALGGGHDLQIDGIGGGNPLTSKVAIISKSSRSDSDVDYLFAQVSVTDRAVDTSPNCGNMLCGVGSFAIERGLVKAQSGETRVRIFNVNTSKRIDAVIQTPNGTVTYEGDAKIDGVPGTAAPVRLTFLDSAGSKTGKLLPSGAASEIIDGLSCTLIDAAMPLMIVAASALGKTGLETPAELDGDRTFMSKLEAMRLEAGRRMGLGDVSALVIPKPVLIAPPAKGGTLTARYFMPHSTHKALAVTGAVGIATACATPGTVANQIANAVSVGSKIRVEHPSGSLDLSLSQSQVDGSMEASLVRTARKIFDGSVYVTVPDAVKSA